MTTQNIVSGAVSTVTELGKDESWLQGWFSEQPDRLGLGELEITDSDADEDDRSFVAIDAERCFSVDVQLGEMEASRGFGVLDNWARNRVRHPDKTHVAVLVTEVVSDRYRTTLETLAEHLPMVVVELQVWKGETEAIVVPRIAVSSENVDLSDTLAARAAAVAVEGTDATAVEEATDEASTAGIESEPVVPDEPVVQTVDEPDLDTDGEATDSVPEDKDDTGVGNPWGLPDEDHESAHESSDSESTGLLSKVG